VNYQVRHTTTSPKDCPDWNDAFWESADVAEIKNFRPEGSAHRPQVSARFLYDTKGIHGIFFVRDQFVRCIRPNYFDEVWKDSCVEFFVQPKRDKGYFNFEFNCGGAFLCNYITDPTRTSTGLKGWVRMPETLGKTIQCRTTLPKIVEPEIKEPTDWTLQFFIPFQVMEEFVGSIGDVSGQSWRGNFFKCADESSHPHWASWSPVDELNFHLPRCFGNIHFAAK